METSKRLSFWDGFWRGLSGPAQLYGDFEPEQRKSDLESLRSDWERIGQDFRVVIAREESTQEDRKSR